MTTVDDLLCRTLIIEIQENFINIKLLYTIFHFKNYFFGCNDVIDGNEVCDIELFKLLVNKLVTTG
jgi:hypothetical protein